MKDQRVPIAVIGAGNMGANHVRVLNQISDANLVEVVEPDPDRGADIHDEYDVRILDSVGDLEQAQAATVAVPNRLHQPVAETLIERGIDVLIEKPLAPSVDGAQEIVDVAAKQDALLQVGHIERFNPAVELLVEILDDQEVIAVEAHRLGPFNEHLSDTDVVFDLMIHDIDIADILLHGSERSVEAVGTHPRSENTDHASALLEYDSGIANVTASHVTHGKIRELTVTTADAYITLGYQGQTITLQRRGTGTTTKMLNQSGHRTEVVTQTPFIQTKEPLKNELEHFVECVQERKRPRVDGQRGLEAVRLASTVTDQVRKP
jgi:predicted dehydrogenase